MARLVVLLCLVVTLGALAWQYPQAFADANRQARENAALDLLDRELGGGNSVLPEQSIAVEARARIPIDASFEVAVGDRQEGWSELATQEGIDTYMRYFLLPRRPSEGAPWLLCFACDRSAYPGVTTVWEAEEEELAILRRPT